MTRRQIIGSWSNWGSWLVPSLVLLVSQDLWGADSQRASLGLLVGLGLPSSSSSAFAYEVEGTFKLKPEIAIGAFLTKYSIGVDASTTAATVSVDTSSTYYGLEGHYFFGAGFKGMSAGIRAGMAKSSALITATSASSTITLTSDNSSLFVAPKVGYDYMLGSFSVGSEACYFLTLSSSVPKMFTFLGSFKFWF